MTHHNDAIIIGGGISGIATAYELAKRNVSVTLLERAELHSMASGWTLAGVRQSGRHQAELPLAKAAVQRWENLADELDMDIEYRQGGNLRLAQGPEDIPNIRQVVEEGNAAGISMHFLDNANAVRKIAPGISPDIAGASFCPTDGHANNHLTVQAYAAAAQRLGADIQTGTEVIRLLTSNNRITGVETANGHVHAGTVIVTAGIYTPRLLAPLGLKLPLEIVLCPVVQTGITEPALGPVLGVAGGGFAGRQEASGRYRITGELLAWDEEIHTDDNTMPSMHQAMTMIQGATRILPDIANLKIHRVWGGLIDRTPDVIPVIETIPGYDGLIVAAGFSGHGFGLGPATGEILADLATTGTSRLPIDAFTLSRFASGVTRQDLALHG